MLTRTTAQCRSDPATGCSGAHRSIRSCLRAGLEKIVWFHDPGPIALVPGILTQTATSGRVQFRLRVGGRTLVRFSATGT
jgi:hypothetical protein